MKYLGVILDETLSWDYQVKNVVKTVAHKIPMLRRLSSFLPKELISQIYVTYMQPLVEYCATVWGYCSVENINRVQHLQNWAARITSQNYDFINTRGIDLVHDLKWQTFEQRRDYLSSNLMFKCMNNLAPNYLSDNITLLSDVTERNTRSSNSLNVYPPRPNIEQFKQAFQYRGGLIWNNLDEGLKSACSINLFKRKYKNLYW